MIITWNCGKCGLLMTRKKSKILKNKYELKCKECKLLFIEGEF